MILLIVFEGPFEFCADKGFQFLGLEDFDTGTVGHKFFLEVVSNTHLIGENGIVVMYFLLLGVVQRQGAEIFGLGRLHAQDDALGIVLVGDNAETVLEKICRIDVFRI